MVKREELSLDAIKQFFVDTKTEADKYTCLVTLYALLQIGQAIVFVQTVKTAKEVTNRLRADGYQVSLLHGKDMLPKDRDAVMKDFRTGKTTVLITTNVLARGIDVLSVTLVVNYDVPLSRAGKPDPETYIHVLITSLLSYTQRLCLCLCLFAFCYLQRSILCILLSPAFYAANRCNAMRCDAFAYARIGQCSAVCSDNAAQY